MSDTNIIKSTAEIIVLPVAYSHGGFAQIRVAVACEPVACEPVAAGEATNVSDLPITASAGREIANAS